MRPGIAMALMRAACELSFHPREKLFGASRQAALVEWRFAVIWLMRRRCHLKLTQIGKFLGRHHTSIIHSVVWMDDRLRDDATAMEHRRRIEAIWRKANEYLDQAHDRRVAA